MSTKSTKARAGRFTPKERAFVISTYPALGPAEIARKLGRSKSGVCKLISQLKETGEIATTESTRRPTEPPPAETSDADGPQDTLGRLRRLRSLLEVRLHEAEVPQVARIASEYRAVVDEIDRLEARDGGDRGDALDDLARALAGKLGG